MAHPLCGPCTRLVVEFHGVDNIVRLNEDQHHANSAELRSCAESGQCSVCFLMLTGINQSTRGPRHADFMGAQLIRRSKLPESQPGESNTGHGDLLRLLGDDNVPMCHVEISATIGSQAARELRGRNTTDSLNPPQTDISIAQEWLHNCDAHHTRCAVVRPRSLPLRVIYLGDSKPRLIETYSQQAQPLPLTSKYVALSYCWGDDANKHILKLGSATWNDFKNGIDTTRLAMTHQEAIQIAQKLGYQYLWIDALCINEDSNDDWEEQSLRIREIFGNADLTILAGRSGDARHGFRNITLQPLVSAASVPYRSPGTMFDGTTCRLGLPRNHDMGPTQKRGWCLQEAWLSHRLLIYGKEQLSFRCRERLDFEDGSWETFAETNDEWYTMSMTRAQNPEPSSSHSPATRVQPSLPDFLRPTEPILESWYALTEEYSLRNFYKPTDNHAALFGIVQRFQDALVRRFGRGKERYMAGLWEMDLVRGLLWKSQRIARSGTILTASALSSPTWEGKVVRRAPSWSWMALKGPICQPISHGEFQRRPYAHEISDMIHYKYLCHPTNPDKRTWGPDPDGWGPTMIRVDKFPSSFKLEVTAPLRQLRVSNIPFDLFKRSWDSLQDPFSPNDHMQQRVVLEAQENTALMASISISNPLVRSDIIAIGYLDRVYEKDSLVQMWGLCLTMTEGLLLEQVEGMENDPPTFQRLGVFYARLQSRFYQHEIDKLPRRPVVLI